MALRVFCIWTLHFLFKTAVNQRTKITYLVTNHVDLWVSGGGANLHVHESISQMQQHLSYIRAILRHEAIYDHEELFYFFSLNM